MAVDPVPYWELSDLEARLSKATVRQILDDDDDGAADNNPVAVLQADSASKVESYLRPNYDLDAVRNNPPNEVKRLALDVAVAIACMRHPEYVRRDGKVLMEMAEKDLERLRTTKTRLDVIGLPEPPKNVGGEVLSGDPDDPDPKPHVFLDDMGDW